MNSPVCLECSRFGAFRVASRTIPHLSLRPLQSGRCDLCDLREFVQRGWLTHASEHWLWEAAHEPDGDARQKLAQVLDIETFVRLEPTPAHRYLAFLAREGLLSECLTTNYDCCLEKAYQETWPQSHQEVGAVQTIFDLHSYRMCAARSTFPHEGPDTPHVLRVFKLNGCAQELTRDAKNHAERILLTATQLQDWRERRWAEDLLRTRFRTTALFTLGFGSDEPQVVHTLHQVLEEFQDLKPRAAGIPPMTSLKNVPILAVYSRPGFAQKQLAERYTQFHGAPGRARALKIRPGKDGHPAWKKAESLDAGVLMARAYQAVFLRLLARAFQRAAQPGGSTLTGLVPHAEAVLNTLAREAEASGRTLQKGGDVTPQGLLAMGTGTSTHAARPTLVEWVLRLLEGPEGTAAPRYAAVHDHGRLYAECAFLLRMLNGGREVPGTWSIHSTAAHPDAPFCLRWGNASQDVWMAGPHHARRTHKVTLPGGQPFSTRLELHVGGTGGTAGLRRMNFRGLKGSEQPCLLVCLDWRDLFPPDLPVDGLLGVAQRLQEARVAPTKFLRRRDPSLHRHARLQPDPKVTHA